MTKSAEFRPHTSHWGAFTAAWQDGKLEVRPHPDDPDPNGIIENFPGALHHRARIAQPMVRRGWLEHGPGADPPRPRRYVPLSWDRALDLLARNSGDTAPARIFGGSYGWASAGRFHHAQSQIHRFLNSVSAAMCAPSTATAPAPPRSCCRTSSATTRICRSATSPGSRSQNTARSCSPSAACR